MQSAKFLKTEKKIIKKANFFTCIIETYHRKEKLKTKYRQARRQQSLLSIWAVSLSITQNGSAGILGNFSLDFYLLWYYLNEQNFEWMSATLSLINCCYISWIELKLVEIKFERDKWNFKVSSLNVLERTSLS